MTTTATVPAVQTGLADEALTESASRHSVGFNLVDDIVDALPIFTPEEAAMIAGPVYRGLEQLTGASITEGMSDDMLDEFGYFVEQKEELVTAWLSHNVPGYESRSDFQAIVKANPEAEQKAILSEFGAMMWLRLNRPDYPQIVAHRTNAILTALQDGVLEVGQEAMRTWLRLRGSAWKQVFEHADSAEQIMTYVATVALHEGREDFELWADAQFMLGTLLERAKELEGEE